MNINSLDNNGGMLAAIRSQHPEWVSPDGQCLPCESYLHELAATTNSQLEPTES